MTTLTAAQRQAIQQRGNVLVVAGAGTGKTSTLVHRCISLLLEENCSLDEILMVTFTEAAAAEMRSRIRAELLRLQAALVAGASGAGVSPAHPGVAAANTNAGDTLEAVAVQELVRDLGAGSDDRIRQRLVKLHRYTQALDDPETWLAAQESVYQEEQCVTWRRWLETGFDDWRRTWLPELKP